MATYAMDIDEKGIDATLLIEAKTDKAAANKVNKLLRHIRNKTIHVDASKFDRM